MGSSWKMKNSRKITEDIMQKAHREQPELGTGQPKRHGDRLHYLLRGKTAPAPKPCPPREGPSPLPNISARC